MIVLRRAAVAFCAEIVVLGAMHYGYDLATHRDPLVSTLITMNGVYFGVVLAWKSESPK